jgi:hypothetical protein
MNLTCIFLALPRGNVGKGRSMPDCTFDPIAVVVDWLDFCRERRLNNLLDLYDATGSLECACAGIYQGREDIARYWSRRLEGAVPQAFRLIELALDNSGDRPCIVLDYIAYNGMPVRIRFLFTKAGKIGRSVCAALVQPSKAA